MSGGHYDYLCFKVREFAERIEDKGDPRRIAFKEVLLKAAEVCYVIEWEDSGDKGKDDTDLEINEFCLLSSKIFRDLEEVVNDLWREK